MKRIYQFLLSFLFLTSGVIAAMDQGQALMTAISNSDITQVQNSLKNPTIDAYAKIGTQTPLELAHEVATAQQDNKNALDIKRAIVDYLFSKVAIYRKFIAAPIDEMTDVINQMSTCTDVVPFIKNLLVICAKIDNMGEYIDTLIHYTLPKSQLIVFPNDLLRDCPTLLPDLIDHHPNGKDLALFGDIESSTLPEWVTWCLDHGAPVNGTNTIGFTPLILAVRGSGSANSDGYIAIVKILLGRGAKANQVSKGETPITLIEKKCAQENSQINQEIRARLKGEPIPTFPPPLGIPATGVAPVSTSGSNPPPVTDTSFTTSISKLFTSYKTWAALACMYLGVKCYKRVTSGYAAKYEKNVIVNEAGTDISVTDENKNTTDIHTGEDNVLDLPKFAGLLTVEFQDTSKNTSKDLVIDLDRYADDDYHMNIIIRPTRWFERFFVRSPLYYSVTWKRKATPQEAE